METWFVSDLHFGHKGILKFGQRQAESEGDLWIKMLHQLHQTIHHKDNVWMLGDMFFSQKAFDMFCPQIPGKLRMVLGNHDEFNVHYAGKYIDDFAGIKKYKGFWLTHCPIIETELYDRVNVHGHIHRVEVQPKNPRYFNVNWDYRNAIGKLPITNIDEIREHAKQIGAKI